MFHRINPLRSAAQIAVFATLALPPIAAARSDEDHHASEPNPSTVFVRGDVNQDGFTDIRDILLASDYLNGYAIVPVIEAIDVRDDGVLDERDLFLLVRLVEGGGFYSPEVLRILAGDVNDDGLVDGRDLRELFNYLYRGDGIAAPLDNADVDGDGRIGLADVARLWNRILAENGG